MTGEEFMRLVEEAGIMSGWCEGLAFDDLPENYQQRIKTVIAKIRDDNATNKCLI